MDNVSSKTEMVATLRTLIRRALELNGEGAGCLSLGRAQGYVDGYLRALVDAGILSSKEALGVVSAERVARSGPATQCLSADISAAA